MIDLLHDRRNFMEIGKLFIFFPKYVVPWKCFKILDAESVEKLRLRINRVNVFLPLPFQNTNACLNELILSLMENGKGRSRERI